MAVMSKILFTKPPPIRSLCPAVPPALAELVDRMLARDVADRPADAIRLAALLAEVDLSGAASEVRTSARPHGVLTGDEQRLVSVVVAVPPIGIFTATTVTGAGPTFVELDASALRGRVEWLGSGSLVATVDERSGSAEDQAVYAARRALALQEQWPEARVAVATGRIVIDKEQPMGEALDRATRMLEATEPRGIRVDSLSASLLERRFEIRQESGVLLLVAEQVVRDEARCVLGKPTPCVGREQELGLLTAALASCLEEPCARAVLVTAAAGVGKSRLRRELMRRLHSHIESGGSSESDVPGQSLSEDALGWWTVLASRGDPLRIDSPFAMLADALRRLAGVDGVDKLDARERFSLRIGAHVPEADRDRVVGFLGEVSGIRFADADLGVLRTARQNPASMAEQIQLATTDFVRSESASRGVLWVLEDAHWADAQSMDVLADVLHELEDRPFAVLAFARPEIAQRFPRAFHGLAQVFPLHNLPKKAAERLVREVLGASVSPEAIGRIVEQAAGNALFLEELIRASAEGDAAGPSLETVVAMLQARLSRLAPPVRRALRAASVFGQHFWIGGVQALVGVADEPDAVANACATLVDAEVIERMRTSRLPGEIEYRFRHALMREAAYTLLTEEDLATGHGVAGWYLEQAGEKNPLVLVDHYKRAHQPLRVLPWLIVAGDAARRVAAKSDARKHYGDALAILERLPETPENRRLEAEVLLRYVDCVLLTDGAQGNLEYLQRAQKLLDGLDDDAKSEGPSVALLRARTQFLTGRVHFLTGNTREAIGAFRTVLPLAEQMRDAELLALPSCLIGSAMFIQGHLEPAAKLLRQAIAPLEEVGLQYEWVRARAYLGITLIGLGRLHEGREELAIAGQQGSELAQPTVATLLTTIQCGALLFTGDWATLVEKGERLVLLSAESGEIVIRYLAANFRAWGLLKLGRIEETLELLETAKEIAEELGGRVFLADWWAALRAEVALAQGRAEEARTAALALAEIARKETLPMSLGRAERIVAQALHALGADPSEIDRHFEESAAVLSRGNLLLLLSETELEWAMACRERDPERAETMYASAIARLRNVECEEMIAEAERRWRSESDR
jgi:tetratricopeptide (TPR) repeat protein